MSAPGFFDANVDSECKAHGHQRVHPQASPGTPGGRQVSLTKLALVAANFALWVGIIGAVTLIAR